jgi:hypothetical protein
LKLSTKAWAWDVTDVPDMVALVKLYFLLYTILLQGLRTPLIPNMIDEMDVDVLGDVL